MSFVGEMTPINVADIEKHVPTVREITLEPEYALGKSRLVLLLNHSDVITQRIPELLPTEGVQLMLVVNDIFTKAPYVGVDFIRPSFDKNALGILRMFQYSQTPLGRALRGEEGRSKVEVYQYMPQSFESRSIYPRDMFMVVRPSSDTDGSQLILSRPPSYVADKKEKTDYSQYIFVMSMEKQLGITSRQIPIWLPGGNVVVSRDFVLTLQDTFHKNLVPSDRTGFVVSAIESNRGTIKLGKDIAVLDFGLISEGKQRVFHLDMLLNVVLSADGREYFLLASPQKARELLSAHGFLGQEPMNFGRWRSEAGYPSYTRNRVSQFSQRLVETVMKAERARISTKVREQTAKGLEVAVGFPAAAHADLGANLHQFFSPANMDSLGEYLHVIRESLLKLGVEKERILEVPSLLFSDAFSEANVNADVRKILSARSVPVYAPVNGVQMRGSEPQSASQFFTVGGVRMFDEEITRILDGIGVVHVPIPSAIACGYGASGLRCLSVPWR